MPGSAAVPGGQRRHVPQRTCVGCGAKRAPAQLLRVAAGAHAMPYLVGAAAAVGRSAYLCYDDKCLAKAFARRAFDRSLKLKIATPEQLRDVLARTIG